jgi:hypothetical protein
MTHVKTLDREYLATHPEGDEKAEITLSASVPQTMGLELNPDGTRPQISIKVTGETYLGILGVLDSLHDDVNPLLMGLMSDLLTEEEFDAFDSLEQAGPLLKERFAEVVVPFRTFTVQLETDEGNIDFAITAPNAKIGAEALHHLTSPSMLTNTAIAMSPETDDEDDDFGDNSVLVVG